MATKEAPAPAPFLRKTYELIDDSSTDHLVSWSTSGNSFVVWRPTDFSREVLPKYFKHNNFSSFVRQLNTYGFRKTDAETWEFANEGFVRGARDQLGNIHRRKSAPSAHQPSTLALPSQEAGSGSGGEPYGTRVGPGMGNDASGNSSGNSAVVAAAVAEFGYNPFGGAGLPMMGYGVLPPGFDASGLPNMMGMGQGGLGNPYAFAGGFGSGNMSGQYTGYDNPAVARYGRLMENVLGGQGQPNQAAAAAAMQHFQQQMAQQQAQAQQQAALMRQAQVMQQARLLAPVPLCLVRQLEHVSQAAPPTAQGGADSSGPRTADVHEAPRGDNAKPHQDAAQTPSGGGAPQGPPPQDGESGAGASGATGSRGSRGEKGGAEAGGASAGSGGGMGIGRGSGGGMGSRGGAPAPQDSGEANKKRKFVSGERAFAQHATSASAPSSSQEVHMSDESLGNSDVSGSGKDATGSGVIRPTPIMANPITPAMMAEFMAKFGSMQAMAAKIEQLEAKVAVMKLAQTAGPSEDLERRLKAQEDWKHSQDRSARSEAVWKQNQELFRLQQQNKNQEDADWQRKHDVWKQREDVWKADQEHKERNEASWKEVQEARHSDAQARKAAEEGRREVEAKWKAAQEAWKAEADEKLRKELGWKASQENRLAWQEKLSNQQHERNRTVEGKLVEQQRKNSSDAATSLLLEARMHKSEAEHKETAARNQILEEKFVGIEGVMEDVAEQAEERIWLRVHQAANINDAQPQDVLKRLLEQSDAALKDIRSRSRSSGGATDSGTRSKQRSGCSGGAVNGGGSGLPRNRSFPSASGLGLVQSSPCSPPRVASGSGRLTRPPGAAPSTSCELSMGGAQTRDECSNEVSSHAGSGNQRRSGSGKRR